MVSPILVHSKASLERSPSPGRLSVDSASLKTSLAQSCSWLPMSRVGLPARFCVHPAERKVSVTSPPPGDLSEDGLAQARRRGARARDGRPRSVWRATNRGGPARACHDSSGEQGSIEVYSYVAGGVGGDQRTIR